MLLTTCTVQLNFHAWRGCNGDGGIDNGSGYAVLQDSAHRNFESSDAMHVLKLCALVAATMIAMMAADSPCCETFAHQKPQTAGRYPTTTMTMSMVATTSICCDFFSLIGSCGRQQQDDDNDVDPCHAIDEVLPVHCVSGIPGRPLTTTSSSAGRGKHQDQYACDGLYSMVDSTKRSKRREELVRELEYSVVFYCAALLHKSSFYSGFDGCTTNRTSAIWRRP